MMRLKEISDSLTDTIFVMFLLIFSGGVGLFVFVYVLTSEPNSQPATQAQPAAVDPLEPYELEFMRGCLMRDNGEQRCFRRLNKYNAILKQNTRDRTNHEQH